MVFFSSLALFLGSYLYLMPAYKSLAFPMFMLGLAGLWMAAFWTILQRPYFKYGPQPVLVWLVAFMFFGTLAAVENGDPDIAVGTAYVSLLYIACTQVMQSASAARSALRAFLWSTHAIVAWSLVVNVPLIGVSYQGAFENPNAMGGVLATLAAIFAALAINARGLRRLVYAVLLLAVTALVAMTRSRGSLVSVLLCFMAIGAIWVPTLTRSQHSRYGFFAVLFALPTAVYFAWPMVVAPLLEKMAYKRDVIGDISDGRLGLWAEYLSDATMLGGGREILSRYDLAAHNTFVSLIAQYGWAAGFLFLLIVLSLTWRCWNRRRSGFVPYLPFFACLSFLTLSMTEGMMLKSPMFAMFLLAPATFSTVARRKTRTDPQSQAEPAPL